MSYEDSLFGNEGQFVVVSSKSGLFEEREYFKSKKAALKYAKQLRSLGFRARVTISSR